MTLQQPISSPFGASATALEVVHGVDLGGTTAIVTGGHGGIGLETTRALAAAGAEVIVGCRDIAKAHEAVAGIDGVRLERLDLIDPDAIAAFANRVIGGFEKIDILVNNAGYLDLELHRDARGHEAQFSTNHLGHFELTTHLWPLLVEGGGARVVSVSSCGHAASPVVFDDIDYNARPYDPFEAYGQSKTANSLFAVWLDEIGKQNGVRAFALHPGGMIQSGFADFMTLEQKKQSGYLDEDGDPVIDPENTMKTNEQGAATSVWCATSPLLEGVGGVYCENCNIANQVPADSDQLLGVHPWTVDREQARRLWDVSAALTGRDIPR
jgi:NAD(P)-dependent dehydrogenase (short-subunit alcohol dehydrogenase family)